MRGRVRVMTDPAPLVSPITEARSCSDSEILLNLKGSHLVRDLAHARRTEWTGLSMIASRVPHIPRLNLARFARWVIGGIWICGESARRLARLGATERSLRASPRRRARPARTR